ncbi:MAG: hypothetical protein OXI88_18985 [Gammaproteobacteria bacterium]|nr:hypothetical protein [Gammaproteobacteria bacterium]MDE0513853.1 hypothetical protein [Gammaproteobacteria bacterium]
MNFERLNPLTGELASKTVAMQPSDIPAICEKAQSGFEAWSKQGPNNRHQWEGGY